MTAPHAGQAMKLFGVTGGAGMGKSTTAEMLGQRGVAVVDTDLIAREIVEPGRPALAEIQKTFGPGLVDEDGCLRRDQLARIVFEDAAARRQLETILHPRIHSVWQKQIERWRSDGLPRVAVIIPLLYETGAESHFDAVICVGCSAATQHDRLRARGWDPDQIDKRIHAQWPAERKMELADYVIWTEAGMDIHAAQLDRIIR
jgi:dephospho-CoA kinase